jgi:hypothetical protein
VFVLVHVHVIVPVPVPALVHAIVLVIVLVNILIAVVRVMIRAAILLIITTNVAVHVIMMMNVGTVAQDIIATVIVVMRVEVEVADPDIPRTMPMMALKDARIVALQELNEPPSQRLIKKYHRPSQQTGIFNSRNRGKDRI